MADRQNTVIRRPWTRTPLVESAGLSRIAGCGIGNFIRHSIDQHPPGAALHFYALSGGNAGLACVHAARSLGQPATVVVPLTTKPEMVSKLKAAGATNVLQQGASLKEAAVFLSDLLQSKADQKNDQTVNIFVPPYDHQFVWSGNGTLAWEIVEQLAELDRTAVCFSSEGDAVGRSERIPDPVDLDRPPASAVAAARSTLPPAAILCSVGGGGLLNGLVEGLDGLEEVVKLDEFPPSSSSWSATPIIATETAGADCLAASMAAWSAAIETVSRRDTKKRNLSFLDAVSTICPHPVTLDRISSAATSLGVSRVSDRTFSIATGMYNNRAFDPVSQLDPIDCAIASSESCSTAGSGASLLSPSIQSSSSSVSDIRLSKPVDHHLPPTPSHPSSCSSRPAGSIVSVVLSDEEAAAGCVALAETDRLMVELACGINVAALFGHRLQSALGRQVKPDEKIVVVVCGGSDVTLERLNGWKDQGWGVDMLMAS